MIKRDQIHGDVEFSDAEMKLINSRSFERLRYIKQLGFAEFEFPGATHTRYQHSLGVCKCVTDMYNAVIKNCPEFYRPGDLELLRMMALVHDLGHSPFSHASEELSPITHEERLYDIEACPTGKISSPTGAGDTYMAAYIVKRLNKSNIYESGQFASIVSTLKLENNGPFKDSILDVLDRLLDNLGF